MTQSRTLIRSIVGACATTLAVVLISPVLGAAPAHATGYGVYFDYALGPVSPDPDWIPLSSYDTSRIGFGLAIDTAVAQDKLFNYRMNLGYEQVQDKFNGTTFSTFNGGSFENIFGFGVYRSKLMRVWIGPALRLGVGVLDKNSLPGGGGGVQGDMINLTAGGGLSAGINVHTGDIGSAAFTIGYQYAYQGRFITGGGVGIPTYLQGRDQRVNFNFAYFFRGKGERFEK